MTPPSDIVFTLLHARHLRLPGQPGRCVAAALSSLLFLGVPASAQAQDMEPRAYANAPIGLNFLIAGYAYTSGGYPLDVALPVTNQELSTNSGVLAYGRVLDLWGQSAKLNIIVPYTWLSGTAELMGQAMQRDISGFADPAFKLSVNLYGAPALSLKEFKSYEQDVIVGASLRVTAPLGQYDNTKVVNLGTNRWTFKPEVGVSKALGPWTLEATAAATFYTDNNDFFNGNKRSQRPLYSVEAHTIYSFTPGIWGSLDLTYFNGGRTTINDTLNNDLQQNWRLGGTLSFPVDIHNSVKLYASSGVAARTGNDFDLLGIAWQYRWGGGL